MVRGQSPGKRTIQLIACLFSRRPVLRNTTTSTRQAAAQANPHGPGEGQQPANPQPGQVPRAPGNNLATPTQVPPRSISRGPESTRESHRSRRAGMDNPLVAFQSPVPSSSDAGPQPTTHTQGDSLSPTAKTTAATAMSNAPASNAQHASADQDVVKTGTTGALDERTARRLRLEAAARLRQARNIGFLSSPALSPSSSPISGTPGIAPLGSQSAADENTPPRVFTPAPTIKVEEPLPSAQATSSALGPETIVPEAAVSSGLDDVASQLASSSSTIAPLQRPIDYSSINSSNPSATSSQPPEANGGMNSSQVEPSRGFESLTTGLSGFSAGPFASPQTRSRSPPFTAPSIPLSMKPQAVSSSLKLPSSDNRQSNSNDVPHLIPLFNPSHPTRPSSFARFFPSLYDSPALQNTLSLLPTPEPSSSMPCIPDNLTKEQLALLAEITKESLETRLKLLQNTQETLQACLKQMQEAMSVLPDGDIQGVLQVVSELNSDVTGDVKGKGKASADITV